MKIVDVVCDDEWGRSSDRKFEDKIVIRVRQERSPCEKYLLVISQLAKAIHDTA